MQNAWNLHLFLMHVYLYIYLSICLSVYLYGESGVFFFIPVYAVS